MAKPAFSLSRSKPALSAADIAAAEGRAVAEVVATPAPVAPSTLTIPRPAPARKELLRNTSLRMSDAHLDMLERVFRVTPGCKSKQELLLSILVPALEKMDPVAH